MLPGVWPQWFPRARLASVSPGGRWGHWLGLGCGSRLLTAVCLVPRFFSCFWRSSGLLWGSSRPWGGACRERPQCPPPGLTHTVPRPCVFTGAVFCSHLLGKVQLLAYRELLFDFLKAVSWIFFFFNGSSPWLFSQAQPLSGCSQPWVNTNRDGFVCAAEFSV